MRAQYFTNLILNYNEEYQVELEKEKKQIIKKKKKVITQREETSTRPLKSDQVP